MSIERARFLLIAVPLWTSAASASAQVAQPTARVQFEGVGEYEAFGLGHGEEMQGRFEDDLFQWLFLRKPPPETREDYLLRVRLTRGSSGPETSSQLRPTYLEFSFQPVVDGVAVPHRSEIAPYRYPFRLVKRDLSSGESAAGAGPTQSQSKDPADIRRDIDAAIKDISANSDDIVRGLLCQIPLALDSVDPERPCTLKVLRNKQYLNLPFSQGEIGLDHGTHFLVSYEEPELGLLQYHPVRGRPTGKAAKAGMLVEDHDVDFGEPYVPVSSVSENEELVQSFVDQAAIMVADAGGALKLEELAALFEKEPTPWEFTPNAIHVIHCGNPVLPPAPLSKTVQP